MILQPRALDFYFAKITFILGYKSPKHTPDYIGLHVNKKESEPLAITGGPVTIPESRHWVG